MAFPGLGRRGVLTSFGACGNPLGVNRTTPVSVGQLLNPGFVRNQHSFVTPSLGLPRNPLPRSTPNGYGLSQLGRAGNGRSKGHGHGEWGKGSNRSHWRGTVKWALAPMFAGAIVDLSDLRKVSHPSHPDFVRSNIYFIPSASEGDGETNGVAEEKPRRKSILMRFWSLIKAYIIEPLSTARRFIHLALIFLPVIITAPILLLEYMDIGRDKAARRRGRNKPKDSEERSTTTWWYGLLVSQMERAGPTFIKLAQWAGSRRDLFPASLCQKFGRLHSNGKPHSLRYTKKVLEKAFNKPFDQIFEEFGEKPMGIGAIAQVYKAKINPDLLPPAYLDPKHQDDPSPKGQIQRTMTGATAPTGAPSADVAIKVLHPRVRQTINRDLKIMSFFAHILNRLPGMKWLSFPEEVEVFGKLMNSQLDLRVEANNLETFEDNFRHRTTVSFPRPLKNFTSKNVLVEEYEDAVPLRAFLREGGGPYDRKIANMGLDAFLHMLLIDNFIHSDLHPGNIMIKFYKPTTKSVLRSLWTNIFRISGAPTDETEISPEAQSASLEIARRLREVSHDRETWLAELDRLDQEGYRPELVFIDTGLVTQLKGQNRKNFIDLFRAVAEFDGYRAGKLMVERCRTPELVEDEETFALKMQHLVLSVKSKTFSLAKIRISDILSEVLHLVRKHHVKMEPDFVDTVISILLLEGIGRQLDPEMDLFKSALPILRQLGSQMNTKEMIKDGIKDGSIGPMIKIWLWIEAREMASIEPSEVDALVKYDFFTPNA